MVGVAPGSALRVLIVDDDADFLRLASMALARRGHIVETLAGGFGVVNRVAGNGAAPPDVVVLDCNMPGLPGTSLVSLLANDRRTAHVPLLLASAADTVEHRSAIARHPHAKFMHKNGRFAQLADEVERLVDLQRGR